MNATVIDISAKFLITVENSRLAEQMLLSITSSPTEANKQQIYARPTDTMHHHRWSTCQPTSSPAIHHTAITPVVNPYIFYGTCR